MKTFNKRKVKEDTSAKVGQGQFVYSFKNVRDSTSKIQDLLKWRVDGSKMAIMIDYIKLMTDDKEIYDYIKQFTRDNPPIEGRKISQRATDKMKQIMSVLPSDFVANKYLDFGGNDLTVTQEMANLFGVKRITDNRAYALEVTAEPDDTGTVNYVQYNGELLSDKKTLSDSVFTFLSLGDVDGTKVTNGFDLITSMMVLHHVVSSKPNNTILEDTLRGIYMMMNPGGFFVIREHDVVHQDIKAVIDIEHSLFVHFDDKTTSLADYQVGDTMVKNSKGEPQHTGNYLSKSAWISKITSVGFMEVTTLYDQTLTDTNWYRTNVFVMSFYKPI